MNIDWANFTPWASLAGGLLIGLATAMLLLFNGRIAGISGIVGSLLRPVKGDVWWRVAFILGLIVASFVYGLVALLPNVMVDADMATLIVAGLLVGVGTRYGSGCTSGPGICGISRLYLRSLVAPLLFLLSGFVTVFVFRHLLN